MQSTASSSCDFLAWAELAQVAICRDLDDGGDFDRRLLKVYVEVISRMSVVEERLDRP